MINLRFHIVSIVAIFLALAIGMFAGSTLLDRATVDVLKGRQKSLDTRNAELRAESDALRAEIAARNAGNDAFGTNVLPELVPGLLTDRPVLLLAARGIDEDVVRTLQSNIRDAGASPLGIVWLDTRADLDNADVRAQVASVLGDETTADAAKSTIVSSIAEGLVAAAAPVETADTSSSDGAEAGTPSVDPSLDVLSKLVDADVVDWESPNDGEPGSRTLPDGGLNLVFLGGEGSEMRPSRILVPLIRAVAADVPGVVVGEVRTPRTPAEAVDDDGVPERGAFVDPLRADDDLASQVVTVDDVDEPFGRLALVLALGELPAITSGAYGMAASATAPFPTPSG